MKSFPPRHARRRAALVLCLCLMAASALAQSEIRIPDVRGDQLLYLYDARPGRVSFLLVSNPGDEAVTADVSFYPLSLQSRLGGETIELGAGGHLVIDPSSFAGGAAAGNAGLAIVTPVVGGGSSTPVVPPEPLTGGYTLANTALASAFGENPFGRLAVTASGERAQPGSEVTGSPVRYQRLEPGVLTIPLYFDPRTLGPAEDDGNRVLLAAFTDSYGAGFAPAPATVDAEATFLSGSGARIGTRTVSFTGVLLSDLQATAGPDVPLAGSGKVFFDVRSSAANLFGVFSQSLGTFASGQRMPAVDVVPEGSTNNPSGCSTADVTATVGWDAGQSPDISGVRVEIGYPVSVSLPGSGSDSSVRERGTNLTGLTDGLFEVADLKANPSGPDDTLSIGLVSLSQPITPGAFARIQFDCASSAAAPVVTDLECLAQASDFEGNLISSAGCTLALEIRE